MLRLFWVAMSSIALVGILHLHAFALELGGRFDHLSVEDGLSQSHVLCMLQDSVGFIWIGNYTGLNRYDGKEVKIYKHDPGNRDSISDHNVRTLFEDSKGVLWVGTKTGGLNAFLRDSETFRHYRHDPADPTSLSGNSVRAIYEDSKGVLWVGTFDGLNRFDREKGSFTHYTHNPDDPSSLSSNEIRVIREDAQNNLWIGTEHGLNRFHPRTKTFTRYYGDPSHTERLRNDLILSLFSEEPGELWVGTEEGGLSRMDTATGHCTHYFPPIEVDAIYKDSQGVFWVGSEAGLARRSMHKGPSGDWTFDFYQHNPYDPKSLPDNEVRVVFEDHSGVLWIGTYGNGACRLSPKVQAFGLYRHEPWNQGSLAGSVVSSVWGDKEYLWLANLNSGLNRVTRKSGEIQHFSQLGKRLPTEKINYVVGGADDLLWVGTQDAGLLALQHPSGEIVHRYRHDPDDPASLSMDNVWYVFEDSKKNLWVGTSKRGLNLLDRTTGKFTRYLHDEADPASLSHNRVRNIYEDSKGTIWVGTNGGLNRFDAATGTFTHWIHERGNPKSLSNNRVTPIIEDQKGRIWVGTDAGLNLFEDPEKGEFKRFTTADGLASDAVQALLDDNDGQLWGSSYKGLFKLDTVSRKITLFHETDGLQGNEFWMNSSALTRDNYFAFGGTKGVSIFRPDSVRPNMVPPTVVITGFKVMNKPAVLEKSISATKKITISYKDRFFSFHFAALDYNNPADNRFAYMLEGFDKEWIDAGNNNSATYTNFDHGRYVFRVRAANSDGVWNETGTSVELIITPPFWKTWIFRLLTVGAIVLAGFFFFLQRTRAAELQQKELQTKVASRTEALRQEVEKHKETMEELREATTAAEEANSSKSVFLTTMSHEIRTPLNAIIGTADLLTETDMNSQQMRYVELLQSSGETLLAIINDILDFSKIEAGQVHLESIRFPLHEEVENAATTLGSQAGGKGVELACRIAPDVADTVEGDPTRLRQVLLNLLSNAVKFTESGEVVVEVAKAPGDDDAMLLFTVRDTGVGIDPRVLDSVFDVFLQADSSTTRQYGGTGLGLAICRRLVGLMDGRIWVNSEPGKGSLFSFTVRLPAANSLVTTTLPDLSARRMLVVDDNDSSRAILSELLQGWGAQVVEAANASRALEELNGSQTTPFDILFIDHRMPGKDGADLIRTIRQEFAMEVPIIVLAQGYLDCHALFVGFSMIFCSQKPFKRKDLARSIFAALGQSSEKPQFIQGNESLLPPMHVLVAEDNPSNREIVRLFLADSPVTLDMAENGKQAIEMVRKNAYDAVLMDMEMPVMDGYEATSGIRELEASEPGRTAVPVIALTAHSFAEHRERCRLVGCDDYLVKPVKKNTLLDVLLRFAPEAGLASAIPQQTQPVSLTNLIPQFIAHSLVDYRHLEEALAADNLEDVRKIGHKIGGAAEGFGLVELADSCKALEAAAQAEDRAALSTHGAAIGQYLNEASREGEDI